MKPRPRSVEREVAAALSSIFQSIDHAPVQRIPVLGRCGPDLSYNDIQLIIDVKSRLKVPQSYLAGNIPLLTEDGLVGIRLERLLDLCWQIASFRARLVPASKMVWRWWEHMDDWRRDHEPQGVSALVLHRPRMPIGHATVIIHSLDRSRLCQRLRSPSHRPPTPN